MTGDRAMTEFPNRRPSCSGCGHFHDQSPRWDYWATEGWCGLSPKWEQIEHPSWHVCGQFLKDAGPAVEAAAYIRRNQNRRFEQDQQARAVKAEKQLKLARKELRVLRAGLKAGLIK